jgi:hypothetical protein
MPRPQSQDTALKRYAKTCSGAIDFSFFHGNSFIQIPGADGAPWFPRPETFIYFAPPLSSHNRAIAYAASLPGDDYCELLRAALRDGDDAAARHNLAVILGALEVAAEQLCGAPSDHSVH